MTARDEQPRLRQTAARAARRTMLLWALAGVIWLAWDATVAPMISARWGHPYALDIFEDFLFLLATGSYFYVLLNRYNLQLLDRERTLLETELEAAQTFQRYKAQFQAFPVPTYVWEWRDGSFYLIDFNPAASAATDGYIEKILGNEISALFDRSSPIRCAMERCLETQAPIRQQIPYQFIATGRLAELDITFSFVPPNLVIVLTDDVTQKVEAERALASSEVRYRQLFESSPDTIFTLDSEGRLTSLNPAFERLTGRKVGEWIGKKFEPLLRRDSAVIANQRLELLRSGGESETSEFLVPVESGEERAVEIRSVVFPGPAGSAPEVLGFARDITAQKKAQQELVFADARFRAFMDYSPVMAWMKDDSFRTVWANAGFYQWVSVPADKVVGRTDAEWSPEDADRYRRMDEKVLATGEVIEAIANPGSGLPATLTMKFPIEVAGTRYVGAVAIDITERERLKEELIAKQQFLRAVIDTMHDSITASDEKGNLTLTNRATLDLFGVSSLDAPSQEWPAQLDLRTPDGERRLEPEEIPLFRAERGEYLRDVEMAFVRRSNEEPRVVLASGQPVVGEGGKKLGAVVVLRDVTASRNLEAQVEQASRMSSLGRLAASVSHEFNNVLMAIQPFTEIIRRLATGQRDLLRAADAISASVQRGRRVTQEILRFARPIDLTHDSFRLHTWIRQILPDLRALLPEQISLILAPEEGDSSVTADKSQLEQVFTNLVSNAKEAMPQGGTLQISVRHGLTYQTLHSIPDGESGDDWIQVTVADSGVGMSKEVMQHIFEPLFTTKRSGGTGLGLAISHQVMAQHGGLILVDSEEGLGSRFHLLLRAANSSQRIQQAHAQVSTRPLRFLLAEDEELVAEGLRLLLEDGGHTVEVASDGKAAIAAVDRSTPDVLILDVRLPDIDGTEVFKTVRSRHPDLPIIFSTGHADESAIADYLSLPRVGYILKPYEVEMLIQIAQRLVGTP